VCFLLTAAMFISLLSYQLVSSICMAARIYKILFLGLEGKGTIQAGHTGWWMLWLNQAMQFHACLTFCLFFLLIYWQLPSCTCCLSIHAPNGSSCKNAVLLKMHMWFSKNRN
jgi:hypothetical protein